MQERGTRPQSTLAGGMDDISSPDLGVDLGSDPFSSLERTGKNTYQSISLKCPFLKFHIMIHRNLTSIFF